MGEVGGSVCARRYRVFCSVKWRGNNVNEYVNISYGFAFVAFQFISAPCAWIWNALVGYFVLKNRQTGLNYVYQSTSRILFFDGWLFFPSLLRYCSVYECIFSNQLWIRNGIACTIQRPTFGKRKMHHAIKEPTRRGKNEKIKVIITTTMLQEKEVLWCSCTANTRTLTVYDEKWKTKLEVRMEYHSRALFIVEYVFGST